MMMLSEKKLGIPYRPNVKCITQPVYNNCEDPFMSAAAIDEMNNTTSTIKHRVPLAMGIPLRIVSSHQHTQKKKIYSRLKSKAKTAKRRKEQRKAL
jgi:hypothetical protein